ncbi:hypothetical protein [Coleofasciculus sp.]|uniref:hypothetical protein n=1 Tax=Coleofasciculus sp. TaxID=3100458 RepID=UPI0040627C0D
MHIVHQPGTKVPAKSLNPLKRVHKFTQSVVGWVDARKPNTIIDLLAKVFSDAIAYGEDCTTTNSRYYSPVSLANQRRISSTWKP